MNKIDPKVTIKRALKAYNHRQSDLAEALGVSRAAVNQWIMRDDRKYLPPLQAYRFLKLQED